MPSDRALFDVQCPCCQATLRVDPETRAVLTHREPEKAPAIDDLAAAAARLKGDAARRDEAFRKSFDTQKSQGKVLERKFDELLKQAKENPGVKPTRAFDFE